MTAWRLRARTAIRSFLFLRFAVLPLLILYAMNTVFDIHVAHIGGLEERQITIGRIYEPPPRAPEARQDAAPAVPQVAASPATTAAGQAPPAIGRGRFEWMAFHLTAVVSYPAILLIALMLMYRHLAWKRFLLCSMATLGAGGFWALKAVGNPDQFGTATSLLLLPTREQALTHYDLEFQTTAWHGVLLNYWSALVVTVFVVIAAASIMHGVDHRRRLSLRRLESKRRDLRLILIIASLLMTFIAFYVGEYLSWPARLDHPASAEFRSVASGLRVFFGTGYTLALLGFAIPAIIALSRAIQRAREAGPAAQDDGEFLHQLVFSREEIAMLASVLVPVLTTILGAAILL